MRLHLNMCYRMSSLTKTASSNNVLTGGVELCETSGRALKLQTDMPHLVSLGGGRLSTAVTLHPIPQGRVSIGKGANVDIPVVGTGVEDIHCYIENIAGIVTLYPEGEQIAVDGTKITSPVRLSQGSMLTIGRSNYLKFNHPEEAKIIKSVLPNSRISMAPISFQPQEHFQVQLTSKPPTGQKKNEGYSNDSILSKVTHFEYLAAQNALKNVSPKVFSANLVTVNTPARDVLGRTPPILKNYTKNITQSKLNYTQLQSPEKPLPMKNNPSSSLAPPNYSSPTPNNLKYCDTPKILNLPKLSIPTSSFNRNPSPVLRELDREETGVVEEVGTGYEEDGTCRSQSECKRNQAYMDRKIAEELKKKEEARLEEILNMCAEYEKQAQWEKTNKPTQNRIKTNGSLPRDKRVCVSPNTKKDDNLHFEFESKIQNTPQVSRSYENVVITCSTPKNEQKPYENIEIYENLQKNSTYLVPHSPRTKIKTYIKNGTPKTSDENLHFSNDISPIRSLENLSKKYENLKNENEMVKMEKLKEEKQKILSQMILLKQEISDLEIQHEELVREAQVEKALVTAEYQSKLLDLKNQERMREKLTLKSQEVDEKMSKIRKTQVLHQKNSKIKLENLEKMVANLEYELSQKNDNVSIILEELSFARESLEAEKKFYEDIEFNNLEEEADYLASKEEIQRELANISKKIEETHSQITELDIQYSSTHVSSLEKIKHTLKSNLLKLDGLKVDLKLLQCDLHQENCLISSESEEDDVEQSFPEKQNQDAINIVESTSFHECTSKNYENWPQKLENTNFAKKAQKNIENRPPKYENVYFVGSKEKNEDFEENSNYLDENKRKLCSLQPEVERINHENDRKLSDKQPKREKDVENVEGKICLENFDISCEKNTFYDKTLDNSKKKQQIMHENETKFSDLSISVEKTQEKSIEIAQNLNFAPKTSYIDAKTCIFEQNIQENYIFNDEYLTTKKEKPSNDWERQKENSNLQDNKNIAQQLPDPAHIGVTKQDLIPAGLVTEDVWLGSERESCRSEPVDEDMARITRITTDAPLEFQGRLSLGRTTVESLERQRQLHLKTQGSQVIELERKRMMVLKQMAQDEVLSQWHLNKSRDCNSFNSTGSEDQLIDSTIESGDPEVENTASASGSDQNQLEGKTNIESDEESLRPQSRSSVDTQTSEMATLNRRNKKNSFSAKDRPLTRYLPIRSPVLDLRTHLETAGHQVDLCGHVIINSSSCRGYLHKMGSKLHGWSKRWFVFDRNRRMFAYFSDKNEKKPRGGAPFQAIQEVYLDHQNIVKSPNSSLTFIVKTTEKNFYLLAPSGETLRIWVDVIFTGAEGHLEFDLGP